MNGTEHKPMCCAITSLIWDESMCCCQTINYSDHEDQS